MGGAILISTHSFWTNVPGHEDTAPYTSCCFSTYIQYSGGLIGVVPELTL